MTTLSKIDGASPPSDPVEGPVTEARSPVWPVTGSDQMCEAIPAAVRNHAWQEPRMCASHAKTTITVVDVERHVCGIHHAAWQRSTNRARTANQWGWNV